MYRRPRRRRNFLRFIRLRRQASRQRSPRLVSIQGTCLSNKSLLEKSLYLNAVAVGGSFIRNGTLLVGPFDDVVSWDGGAILQSPAAGQGASQTHGSRCRGSMERCVAGVFWEVVGWGEGVVWLGGGVLCGAGLD